MSNVSDRASQQPFADMHNELLNEMRDLLEQGYGGSFLVSRYTRKIDNLISELFNSMRTAVPLALIATGGYGRAELSPFSDIDIMFFARDRVRTSTAEVLLYKLWDTGLTISHSFRTPEECIEEAFKDSKTRTSLLETRYIAGDKELYSRFRDRVYPEIAYKRQKKFIREKLVEMEKRHSVSGDSVFLLEPNIKEGEGGLRDVHTAYWLAKAARKVESIEDFSNLLSRYDYGRFLSAYDFMLKTRCCLHLESKRKNDVLSFDYQRQVAEILEFKDSEKFSSSERFMRYYYLKSKAVKDITRRIMAQCSSPYIYMRRDLLKKKLTPDFFISGGKLVAARSDVFENNPNKIMECFYLYSKTGKKFSDSLRESIRSNLLKIDKEIRSSAVSVNFFLEIFRSIYVYDTLREMHETGVLGRFIPEFGALRLLVVHEPYHMYTVDEHTLLAVKKLELLRTTHFKHLEHLKAIGIESKHFDLLLLALLFHDIGKAAGKHHEEEGYKRLKNIMDRFNLESKKRQMIEFLVKNHILMSKIALRREISDLEVIARFSDIVGDHENLGAMYLITYADMSAVNPRFFNSWKLYFLKELYDRTDAYLAGMKEDRAAYISSIHDVTPEILTQDITQFIDEMPERYLLSTTKKRVLDDYKLVRQMKENGFSMRIDSSPDALAEIVVSASDRPGLFSRIVGFLSSKGLNIVSGRIYTGKNGDVIDKITVSNWKDIWWEEFESDLEEGLKNIIIHEEDVRIVRRQRKSESFFDIFIELDNEASEEFSLIEIFSSDRLGLLYDISNVFFRLGINIVSARINTESGLAQDVFYVQTSKKKINYEMAQVLLQTLWTTLKEK